MRKSRRDPVPNSIKRDAQSHIIDVPASQNIESKIPRQDSKQEILMTCDSNSRLAEDPQIPINSLQNQKKLDPKLQQHQLNGEGVSAHVSQEKINIKFVYGQQMKKSQNYSKACTNFSKSKYNQSSNLIVFNEENKCESQKPPQVESRKDKILQRLNQQAKYMNPAAEKIGQQLDKSQVVQYVVSTIERCQPFRCSLAHFLIPCSFVLLIVYTYTRDRESFIMRIFFIILKKLNQDNIKSQIASKQELNEYLIFLLNYQNVRHDQIISMLRKFLLRQAKLSRSVCPYYYNFFAFIVNKEIIFGGNIGQDLVEYTIDYKHPYYGNNFTVKEVCREIHNLEEELGSRYHSGDI